MTVRPPLSFLAYALLLSACQPSDSASMQVAKVDLGPVPGAGFSASMRADLAKATGIAAPAKAAVAEPPPSTEAKAVPPTAAAPTPTAPTPTAPPAPTTAEKPATGKPAEAGSPVAAAPPPPTTGKPAGTAAAPEPAAAKPAASPSAPTSAGAAPAAGNAAAKPGEKPLAATPPAPVPPPTPVPPPAPATGGGELSGIKLTLNEGWTRDSNGPGTFSFFAPGDGGKNIRFVFRYGYEAATAPLQREEYKAWLGANKLMTVAVDRQRGAAWYLEGAGPDDDAMFRYVITYGGRLLVCGGSLYKRGAASGLGDLRDEIVKQAKKICESMDL